MTRVEKLFPQGIEQVKPDENEDVDGHPDHLQTQSTAGLHHRISH